MGNSVPSKSNYPSTGSTGGRSIDDDDFEPIDKPPSPTWMGSSTLVSSSSPVNELATSGILVERVDHSLDSYTVDDRSAGITSTAADATIADADAAEDAALAKGRRIVKVSKQKMPVAAGAATTSTGNSEEDEKDTSTLLRHHPIPKTAQSDQELLEESLVKDKQSRLNKLQHNQKVKRNKAVDERRKGMVGKGSSGGEDGTSSGSFMANPFSRFLSVFSVEPKFPSHKRRYEPSVSEVKDPKIGDLESKRPKIDPHPDDEDDEDNNNDKASTLSIVEDWCNRNLPEGWQWMAVIAAATGLLTAITVMSSSRTKTQRLTW